MFHQHSSPVAVLRLSFLPACFALALWLGAHTSTTKTPATPARYQQIPLSFAVNRGQAAPGSDFLAAGPHFNLALSAQEAVFTLSAPAPAAAPQASRPPALTRAWLRQLFHTQLQRAFHRSAAQSQRAQPRVTTVRMKLVNADAGATAAGLDELPGKLNYLRGNDPARWQTGVPTFARVRYTAVYPGIDLVYYGQPRQLEYDFIIAPHADPARLRLRFEGAERIEVDAAGDLVLHCGAQQLRQHKPVVYQLSHGARQLVAGAYALTSDGEVHFQLGAYDPERELVIDPVLSYATYWGSTGSGLSQELDLGDFGADIAVDATGNAYIAGYTFGNDFPIERPVQPRPGGGLCGEFGCPDMFVTKFNAAGTAVLYSTYLGGAGFDQATGIAVDAAGQAYLTGATGSDDFPAGRPPGRAQDAVIAKLSADGSRLLYAYALGGSGNESGNDIAVDAAGNAYITGTTFRFEGTNDFPVAQPYQRTPGGGDCRVGGETIPCSDAFVARLNANGQTLDYSSYLGGNKFEAGSALALDRAGRVIVTGITSADNFPKTPNAFQSRIDRSGCDEDPDFCFDGYLAKFSPDGGTLLYSTYLGGGSPDFAQGLAVDAADNILLSGTTLSTDFPLKNPLKTDNLLATAFVTKFDAGGALVYSTLLGGRFIENLLHFILAPDGLFASAGGSNLIAADAAGNAYVTGMTFSPDFPTLNPAQREPGGGTCTIEGAPLPCPDAFVTKLNPQGALVYSSFLGGRSEEGGGLLQALAEGGFGVAADAAGNAYVIGLTSSKNFPVVNPRQPNLRGASDVFIAKLSAGETPGVLASVNAASYQGPTLAAESIAAAFGASLAPRAETATTTPLPLTLAGVSVRVRDSNNVERNAPLFFVSANQINYLLPLGTADGTASVTVSNANSASAAGEVRLVAAAPGLFAADGSGQGLAAAVALRVRANGTQVFEPVVRFDAATNRFTAVPIDLGPAGERVFLLAFGTGFRFATNVTGHLGGTPVAASIGAVAGLAGLDQANLEIPRSLIGRGEIVVTVTANGTVSNGVRVNIR
jgi:uncharacterized protein (TIGR03437 family)